MNPPTGDQWGELLRALATVLSGGTAIGVISKLIDAWLKRGDRQLDEARQIRKEQRDEIAHLKKELQERDDELLRTQAEKLEEMKKRLTCEAQLELLRTRLEQEQIRSGGTP